MNWNMLGRGGSSFGILHESMLSNQSGTIMKASLEKIREYVLTTQSEECSRNQSVP